MNLKYDTNELIYKRDSQRENKVVVTKGEVAGGGTDWEFGISKCKLVYIKWIDNKVLLYSMGNYS